MLSRPALPAARAAASNPADQLARRLAADIMEGRQPVGSDLPTEAELATAEALPPATVRAALRRLEAVGLIARQRGQRARVVAGDIRASYVVTARGAEPGAGTYLGRSLLQIDRRRPVRLDAELAVLLGAQESSPWLHLAGLRHSADPSLGALSSVDVWLATKDHDAEVAADLTAEAVSALVGATVVEVEERVTAGSLTPAQARHLHARGGSACLQVMRRFLRRGGVPVAAMRDVHPADKIGVTIRLLAG